jgi:hypothetical protein
MNKPLLEKIWLGLLPLSILYWGFAIGGGIIWKILFNFVDENNDVVVNIFLFSALVYQIFINVGVWRAAGTYEKSVLLAWLAKIATTIGTVILLITFLGFSKLKTIQNDMHSDTYSNYKQSDKKYDRKTSNDDMIWIPIDDELKDSWYASNMIDKKNFNILNLWLKREIRERALLSPTNYMYTIMHVNIDCNAYTFMIDYAADVINHGEPFYSTAGFRHNHAYIALTDWQYANKHPLLLNLIYDKCAK